MSEGSSDLMTAAWHVTQGRRIVARRKAYIARLQSLGHPTKDEEQTLRGFETTLHWFEENERQLRKRTELAL